MELDFVKSNSAMIHHDLKLFVFLVHSRVFKQHLLHFICLARWTCNRTGERGGECLTTISHNVTHSRTPPPTRHPNPRPLQQSHGHLQRPNHHLPNRQQASKECRLWRQAMMKTRCLPNQARLQKQHPQLQSHTNRMLMSKRTNKRWNRKSEEPSQQFICKGFS